MTDPRRQFDAAVVGLGAAGCQAAHELTARGLDVVALDAGRMLETRDLPEEFEPPRYLRKELFGRRWVQARSVSFHPRIQQLYVDDRSNPYTTRSGDTFLWIRGRQVGGRLHTWARMSLRLSQADLKRADEDGWGQPWPLDYADLEPYYDRIETQYGLRGARDQLAELPDGRVTEEERLQQPALHLKDKVEARWPERRLIAPRTLRNATRPEPIPLTLARESGRLEILTDSPASRILLDEAGKRVVGLEAIDTRTGDTRSLRADRIFLCASAIESVRLLLLSRSSHHPAGIGNAHDQLGRYLMDHNFVVGTGPTGPEYRGFADSWRQRAYTPLDLSCELDYYIPDFSASLASRGFLRGFGVQGKLTPTDWGMGIFGEMLPQKDNRITLSRRKDALGIPVPNIALRRGENDRLMIRSMQEQLREICAVGDLTLSLPLPGWLRGIAWKAVGPEVGVLHPGLAIHETGGARMGSHPENSVTDERNRVWGVEELYVTDGACFPSTGCQNPTLTIMALTARACDFASGAAP